MFLRTLGGDFVACKNKLFALLKRDKVKLAYPGSS